MHRLSSKSTFRVEVAPAVWRELGAVPGHDFKRMQAELENVAQLIGLTGAEHPPGKVHRIRVDDHEGLYQVDPDRQVIRLMSVFRSPLR